MRTTAYDLRLGEGEAIEKGHAPEVAFQVAVTEEV